MSVQEKLLTVKEVADITRITPAALAQLRYMKRGPSYLKPTPQTVLYKESAIRKWLKDSEVMTS